MFILAVGILARAAVGPADRLLNGRVQAMRLHLRRRLLAINLALCVILIPRIGIEDASTATSTALVVQSIILYLMAKRQLGFHVFIRGGGQTT